MKSDIYRDKIVNTFKKRKEVQDAFIAKKGIITPIRAYDFDVFTDDCDETFGMEKLFNEYTKIVKMFNISDEVEKFKLLKNYCTPIGYFVACPEDGNTYVKFGFSVCNLRDDFNKDLGLLTAFNKSYALPGMGQIPANKIETFQEDKWFAKFKNDSKILYEYCTTKARYWPISFEEQYKLFKKRCSAYYKNIVK